MQKIQWIKLQSLTDYQDMLNLMDHKVDQVIRSSSNETIFLLEHPDIYTAGTNAKPEEMLDHSVTIPIYHIGRGGKYTYHGPGQRIIYPILNLANRQKDLHLYVHMLEKWIIATLNRFNLDVFVIKGKIGIWVKNSQGQEEKIAAIGIRVRKWVTYHGISVNIAPDLQKFNAIVPCGLAEFGVTSIAKLGKDVTFEQFDQALQDEFYKIF